MNRCRDIFRLPTRLLLASACLCLTLFTAGPGASAARADFGFLPGDAGFALSATSEGGAPDVFAGSHPFELTTSVGLGLEGGAPQPGGPFTDGDLKDLQIALPPGLIENPAALAQCSLVEFNTPRVSPFEASRSGESCPNNTQVGVLEVHSNVDGGSTRSFGLFNLTPPPGAPSQIGANAFGMPIVFTPLVRQAEGEYGLTLALRNLSQRFDLYGFKMTVWGVPWSLAHNTERGNCLNEAEPDDPWGKCSPGRPRFNRPQAYLSLPPSCDGPLVATATADSWQQPGVYLPTGEPDLSRPGWSRAASTGPAPLQHCDLLAFNPEATGQLTTARAASPTGFDLAFVTRDKGLTDPLLSAPSQPEKAVVVLPDGMTLNPSLAAGLGTCSPAQYAAETVVSAPGAGCPNASKIGDFTVTSPLFPQPLTGALFLAKPDDKATSTPGAENPFDSLLALYIVAKAPERGLIVKVAGEVHANPDSGQLTAVFEHLPQLPYSSFRVHFREGQRSPLLSPPSCGTYATQVTFNPWLDPNTAVQETSSFAITAGIEGGPCPTGAAPPFSPSAKAGNLNANAGSYTPFYLRLTRADTEAEITSYSANLPPGLLGKIAGIPYCSEAAINAAKHNTGVGEELHPSCPAASEIGHTVSGYGVGPVLAYAPGGLYLAGPYHGSAFSVVAVDSATVGPFDLGTIIVRSAIRVDPRSAQVSIDSAGSDPIPHIIDGIPIHLRDVRVAISRPNLTLNPTSCDPFSVVSVLTGAYAPFADPVGARAVASVPFQTSNCSALSYAPKFGLRLKGGTKRGNYPTLRAVFTPRAGDANTAAAAVTLPPTEFLAQNHIKTICTRPQSEADACPSGAIVGKATAITPLLAEPMQGPVYLRSSDNPLPDLVTALHGHGIRVLVEGQIDSSNGGIRARFVGLPDAPVSKFTMSIFGGAKRGILQNAANLCAAPQIATARFVGQNNQGEALRPRVSARCPRQKKKHHHPHNHHRGGGR